jgi:hypothetical protein
MTTNKQDEFIEKIMANHDMAITVWGEASQVSEGTIVECCEIQEVNSIPPLSSYN